MEKPFLFKLDELDEYILEMINNEEINKSIVENFLTFFSRAYTMIEIKHKGELDPKYEVIHKTISSYLGLLISSPENFGISISNEKIIKSFIDYYNEVDNREFFLLINEIFSSLEEDPINLRTVFSTYILGIFHSMNLESQSNFYQCDKIKHNLSSLTNILNDHEKLRKSYTENTFFRPNNYDGRMLQNNTPLGYYFNLVSFECNNQSLHKTVFNSVEMVKNFINFLF